MTDHSLHRHLIGFPVKSWNTGYCDLPGRVTTRRSAGDQVFGIY